MNKFLSFVERFRGHDPLLVEAIIGGYHTLIESVSVPRLIYHETSIENARSILSDGFKTGKDLQKGEGTDAIFFAPSMKGMKGTAYSRGEGRRVRIEVDTSGLNLIDLSSLNSDPSLPSYKQPSYLSKQAIEYSGEFPDNYDGAYVTTNDSIYEIMLKPSVATEHMTGRVFNLNGALIESENVTIPDLSKYNDIIQSHSISELVNYDWNKIAFGFSNDDVLNIPLSKIKIKWKEDMLNVDGFDMGKYFKDVDYASLPPIEVSYDGKNFYLEDGHHRYGYAKKLNMKSVPAIVEITANPFKKLGFTIDDVVKYKKQTLTEAKSDDEMLMDELSEFVNSGYVPAPQKAEPEKAPIKEGGTVSAYHGSNAVFDEFRKEKIGTNFPNTKDGFFFSDDLEYVDYLANKLAKEKGGVPTRYTCELSLGRTYTLRNYFDTFSEDEATHMYGITQGDVIDIFDSFRNDIIAKAHANKCNSIHFKSHGINLYVVFEASQIRILDYTKLA